MPALKKIALAAAGLLAATTLAACADSANSAGGGDAGDKTITMVVPDTSWSFAIDNGFGGSEPTINVQGTLLRKPYVEASSGDALQQNVDEFEGYLAESYEVSDDGLVYTFHLSDAVSQAGNEISTDDVLWSWERRINSPRSVSMSVQAPMITSMDQFAKVDDKTFTITIERAGYGVTMLALLSDLTAHVYDSTLLKEHATDDDPYAVEWSATNVNHGFGPYEVVDLQPNAQVTLKAREDFVLGKPDVDTIIMKVVPDAGTRANAVRSGDADLASGLQPADLVELAEGEGTTVPVIDNPNAYVLMPLVTNKAPFDDVAVRQAFGYAVPYDQIVEDVYQGKAVRNGPSFLRRDRPGYDGSGFTDFAYDPARAKQMLADAGYPDGVEFTITVSAAYPDIRETAIQIQTAAKEAGFDIEINQVPDAAYAAGRVDHTFQSFIVRDWPITLSPSYELLVYTAEGGSNNLADWEDPDFYAALEQGYEEADPFSDAAGKAWNAAEQIYVNEAPILFIAQIQPNVAMSDSVGGFAWRSDNQLDFSQLTKS